MKRKLKVLQIENNEDDALLIVQSLKKFGYQVCVRRVNTLPQLNGTLKETSWDIVLSDSALPECDGICILKQINRLPHLPCIIVSEPLEEQVAVKLLKAGAIDLIDKNNLVRLGPAVQRFLRAMKELEDKENNERIIQTLIKGMGQATGYQALINILTGIGEWLGTEHGIIGRLGPGPSIETMAFIADNRALGNLRYDLEGTPCDQVIQNGITLIPKKLRAKFSPSARHLIVLEAESYLGLPLKGSDMKPIGIMFFMSRAELIPPKRYQAVLDLAAVRAANEIERIDTEAKIIRLDNRLNYSQRLEAIGTMAGGIAHDFNNILTGIIGYSEMAKNEMANIPATRSKISKVLQASYRAKELVQQILNFSRHTSDEKLVIDLSVICREAMKLLRASIPASIEFCLEIDRHCEVNAAPGQMHQIIMNLCTNAYHAMTPKGGKLTLRLDQTTLNAESSRSLDVEQGEYIRLTVTDTGYGIPPDIKGRIFDPYFTTKEKGVGTGLGLTLIHGIVQSHSGAISVESEEGQGATFTIWLPAIKANTRVYPPAVGDQFLVRGSERILLVDDEELIRQFAHEILEMAGYTVTIANNGLDAWNLFQNDPNAFDLLLTDLTMPKMSGLELAQNCLATRLDLPIILCTGYNDQVSRENALHAGICLFLEKPVPANDLCHEIRQALDSIKKYPTD